MIRPDVTDAGGWWLAEVIVDGDLYVTAWADGSIVGCLIVYRAASPAGDLWTHVAPAWQRRGIATRMYLAAVRRLGRLPAMLEDQSCAAQALWRSLERRGDVTVTRDIRRAYLTVSHWSGAILGGYAVGNRPRRITIDFRRV